MVYWSCVVGYMAVTLSFFFGWLFSFWMGLRCSGSSIVLINPRFTLVYVNSLDQVQREAEDNHGWHV